MSSSKFDDQTVLYGKVHRSMKVKDLGTVNSV